MTEGRTYDTKSGVAAAIVIGVVMCLLGVAIFVLGDQAYLWVKAIHLVAVISWMVGLLYLPRLFVYHCDAKVGSELSETFKVMERRLVTIIATPALIVTWLLGLWMAWQGQHYFQIWFLAKFVLVFGLSGLHGYFTKAMKDFAADKRTRSARHWRMMNEIPALILLLITVLVIVKPI